MSLAPRSPGCAAKHKALLSPWGCRHRTLSVHAGTPPGTATHRGITQTPSFKMQPRDVSQGDTGLCAQGKDCYQLTGPSHHDPLLLHSTPTSIACALLTTAPEALPPPPHSSKPRSFLIPPLLLLKTAFKSVNWCQQVMPHPRARLAPAPSHPWPCRLPSSPLAGPGGRAHTKGVFGSGNNRRPGGAGSPRSHRLGWLWQK